MPCHRVLHDEELNDKEKDDLELDSVSGYTGGMSTEADPQLVERWRAIQSAYLKTSNTLDRELSAKHGIGLNEFETLDLLAEYTAGHSAETCRMKDLTALSPMTQSALSKIVDRLEKAGYVRRAACADDRRALFVELTDAGTRLHADAAVLHRELLEANLTA